jgi:hypothetical protein
MADQNDNINPISDSSLPSLPPNLLETKKNINENVITISSEDIHKHKKIIDTINNELTAYSYVSLIFAVVIIILIGILINDINCKVLNLYYNTNKYNDNIIIKMLIV